jgi:hypothetical protein
VSVDFRRLNILPSQTQYLFSGITLGCHDVSEVTAMKIISVLHQTQTQQSGKGLFASMNPKDNVLSTNLGSSKISIPLSHMVLPIGKHDVFPGFEYVSDAYYFRKLILFTC